MKRFFLTLGLLFLCARAGFSLTLAEARTEVRRLVKDTASSSSLQRYSDTVLLAFLNQSQREVVTASLPLENTTFYVLTSGVTYYSLPSEVVNVKFVRFKDSAAKARKLQQVSYKATLESNPDYERISGPPFQYLVRASTYSKTTLDISYLPVPTTSSTGTVTITYYKQATDLVNDSDVLLDGDSVLLPYGEAIVYQVVYKIKLIEGDIQGASTYSGLYQQTLKDMNSRLGELPDYSPGLSGGSSTLTGGVPR